MTAPRRRVLVACEFSGIVRDAFAAKGWDAWSCDLLPTEREGQHFQMPAEEVLSQGATWDLMIAHPPCTHLAVSGAAWFHRKQKEQAAALEFVRMLLNQPIPRIALENPVSVISSRIRKPDQIIQPWMFGHAERKTTCLWLKNLPKLTATSDLLPPPSGRGGDRNPLDYLPPSPDRWKKRSRTYQGIADAMAEQWSNAVAGEGA